MIKEVVEVFGPNKLQPFIVTVHLASSPPCSSLWLRYQLCLGAGDAGENEPDWIRPLSSHVQRFMENQVEQPGRHALCAPRGLGGRWGDGLTGALGWAEFCPSPNSHVETLILRS